jgi:hypothetical protein
LAHASFRVVPFVALLLLGVSGCGNSDPDTVKLTGRVTLDGKPVGGASVAFVGRQGARLATAQTNAAGEFTIVAALGTNAVSVAKASTNPVAPPVQDDGLMPTDAEYKQMQQAKVADTGVPAKYADPKTSGIAIDVVSGMSDIELALSGT